MAEIEAILLAAGESRRMGFPKPLLKIGNQTFIGHLSDTMLAAAPRLVIVVGAHAARVRRAIARDPRIVVVENPDYLRGQLSSLKAGLRATSADARAVLVHLTDHPTVARETFKALIGAWRESRKPIVIARHHGRRGHPVLFNRSVFGELLDAPEDRVRARSSTRTLGASITSTLMIRELRSISIRPRTSSARDLAARRQRAPRPSARRRSSYGMRC